MLGFGVAAAAAGLGALAIGVPLGASAFFPLKALLVVELLAVLALPALPTHGRATFGVANALTLARAVGVGWIAAFVAEPVAESVVGGLISASAFAFWLDWLDGKVARHRGESSPFGALLDQELDGLFVLVLCLLAWDLDRTGPWVMVSGALRYLFLAAMRVWPWMRRPLPPLERRRFVCGVQIVCLLGCLVPWPVAGLSVAFAAFGLAALVGSFGADTVWLVAHRADPA